MSIDQWIEHLTPIIIFVLIIWVLMGTEDDDGVD